MEHIVKRKGHKERYDERKVYASIYAACMTLRMPDGEAELLSDKVTKEVTAEYRNVQEVSAHSIHKFISECLKKYDHEVAYMYSTHKDIS